MAVLLRPHQYLKNLFIFAPLFFSGEFARVELLIKTSVAFVSFSLVASALYIFNDYRDIEDDRKHPLKKTRPLASGAVSINYALGAMIALFASGTLVSYPLSLHFFYLIIGYTLLNLVYSMKLKHIPIVDASIISIGFVLRVLAGSIVTDVVLSMWIILMTFLLALFLSLAKRRDDVLIYMETGNKTRNALDGYNLEFLNASMVTMAAVTIVAYVMYAITPEVVARFGTDKLYLTTFFVICGLLRYLQIAFVEKNSGSPTRALIRDRFIQLVLAGWIASFAVLIYRNRW